MNYSDMRMNNDHDHINSALRMLPFIQQLRRFEKYATYYDGRSAADKNKFNTIINDCNGECEEKMRTLLQLTGIFKRVHLFCSSQETPPSAFPPVARAMYNEIMNVIRDEKFDRILGENASTEVKNMLLVRFNFDGKKVQGRKAPLMDPYHNWAFLCDPCQHELRCKFEIGGILLEHINDMIEFYIPQEELTDEQVAAGVKTARQRMKQSFMVSYLL
jgi:hypothetical protein